VAKRSAGPRREPPRDVADLGEQVLVGLERDAGRARDERDGAVVVGRAEAAGDEAEVGIEAVAERVLQLVLPVADDLDPRRLEAESKRLACEERAVAVRPVAADELAAGDHEGRPPADQGQAPVVALRPRAVTRNVFTPPAG